jgi:hypothetical protein
LAPVCARREETGANEMAVDARFARQPSAAAVAATSEPSRTEASPAAALVRRTEVVRDVAFERLAVNERLGQSYRRIAPLRMSRGRA